MIFGVDEINPLLLAGQFIAVLCLAFWLGLRHERQQRQARADRHLHNAVAAQAGAADCDHEDLSIALGWDVRGQALRIGGRCAKCSAPIVFGQPDLTSHGFIRALYEVRSDTEKSNQPLGNAAEHNGRGAPRSDV